MESKLLFLMLIYWLFRVFLWVCFTFAVINTLQIGLYWTGDVNLNEWFKLVCIGAAFTLWFNVEIKEH